MRIKTLSIVITSCFLLLIVGLGYTQFVRGNFYRELSEKNRIRLLPLLAKRGAIYDCNGKTLAEDRISFNVCIVPQELEPPSIPRLGKILNFSEAKIERILKKDTVTPFAPVVIASDVDYKTVAVIEERNLDLAGVLIDIRPLRYYPYGKIGAHVIGYLGKINPRELENKKKYGYQVKDLVGRDGIEMSFDALLKGTDGGQQVEVDYRGRVQRVLGNKKPIEGDGQYLTINMDLEKLAWGLLEGYSGVIIIMDSNSGAILTMVNRPAYDPNVFLRPAKNKQRMRLLKDESHPLLNRAISSQYPPGSIFKIITALTALEMNKITPGTREYCDGKYKLGRRSFRCWNEDGHGWLNLQEAIAHSCNIYFYKIGLLVGTDAMARFAKYFGFGRPSGIELPGETGGLIPTRRWKRLKYNQPWYDGETCNLSIGQGYVLLTPLQAVRMVSVVANGGVLPRPHLVENPSLRKKSHKLNIANKNLEIVKQAMLRGVSEEEGTSHRVYIADFPIAAKTGTAQLKKGRSHSWFLGFCPDAEPNISFVVFLEHGGYGSQRAADIARELIEGWRRIQEGQSRDEV